MKSPHTYMELQGFLTFWSLFLVLKNQQKCIISMYLTDLPELYSVSASDNHLWKPCGSLFVKLFSYWQLRTGGFTNGSHTVFQVEGSFLLHESFLKPCVHSLQASGWLKTTLLEVSLPLMVIPGLHRIFVLRGLSWPNPQVATCETIQN